MGRGWGEGAIFHVNDPKRHRSPWAYSIPAGQSPTGKRITRYARSKAEAKASLRALQRAVATGERLTVYELAVQFLGTVKPSMKRSYEQHASLHLKPLHDLYVDAVRPSDIRAVKQAMTGQYAANTIRKTILTAKRMFALAVDDGLREDNPALSVKPPKGERTVRPLIGFTEARRILEAFRGHKLEALVTVALSTGLRRSELLRITWGDIKGDVLHVSDSKTPSGVRSVPLPDIAIEALTRLSKDSVKPFPFHEDYVSHEIPRVLVRAGLPKMSTHGLRHAHASLLRQAGINETIIRDQLGHSSIAMTSRYGGVVPEAQREAARAIGERLG